MSKGRGLSFKEKLEIIFHYESLVASRMKIIKNELTEWANGKFDTTIPHITIGRVLKKKSSLTTFDMGHLVDSKRIRKVQCSKVEQACLQPCKRRAQSYLINCW